MTTEQLLDKLREPQAYELLHDSKRYQFEVRLIENTVEYVHIVIAIDDGTLPASLLPLTQSFIRQKRQSVEA